MIRWEIHKEKFGKDEWGFAFGFGDYKGDFAIEIQFWKWMIMFIRERIE